MNSIQVPIAHNISPAILFHVPIEAVRIVAGLVIVGALAIRRDWLATAVGQLGALALPLNPYVDWLVPPALAALARPSRSEAREPTERS